MKTELTLDDEKNIVKEYVTDLINGSTLCSKYRIRRQRFIKILKNHGHQTRKSNDTRIIVFAPETEQKIIKLYNSEVSIKGIIKSLNLPQHVDPIKRCLNKHNIKIVDRTHNKSHVYDRWIKMYGQNKADKKMLQTYQKKSKASTGKNNPMYGKPSPKGSGVGWKGWYKNNFFRSLRELSYMLYLDKNNIKWTHAERKRFSVEYQDYKGANRTYRPDFLVENKKLIEIKPIRLQKTPLILAKKAAMEKFCLKNGFVYELLDFPINSKEIKIALLNKLIKFTGDYEARFLNFLKNQSQTSELASK